MAKVLKDCVFGCLISLTRRKTIDYNQFLQLQ
jgi:hypothetical protein